MPVKRESIVRLRRNPDGTFVQVLRGGKTRQYEIPDPNLEALDRLTDDQLTARALADPDNPPIDDATSERMAVAGRVKAIRLRSSASQTVFAATYGIPLATLRDWEYGRRMPDSAALTLLKLIDLDPKAVERAMTTYRSPEEAYEHLKEVATLVGVASLREFIREVIANSAFKAKKLLEIAESQQDDDVPVSNTVYLNVKIVVEQSRPKTATSFRPGTRA